MASRFRFTLCSSVMLLFFAWSFAAAQSYSISDLRTLGGSFSEVYGINASSQSTGSSQTSSGADDGFRVSGGVMSDLNITGSNVVGRGINASGQVAGYYYNRSYQAFLWTNGKTRDLGNLGGSYAEQLGLHSLPCLPVERRVDEGSQLV